MFRKPSRKPTPTPIATQLAALQTQIDRTTVRPSVTAIYAIAQESAK